MATHHVVVEIFLSESKCWADRQTKIAVHRRTQLAWLKTFNFTSNQLISGSVFMSFDFKRFW